MLILFLFLSIFVKSDFVLDGYTYHILESQNNEVQIVNCSITAQNITVPSTVSNEKIDYQVTSIAKNSFSVCNSSLTEIYFPHTLQEIEEEVFKGFRHLQKIGYIDSNNQQIQHAFPPLMTQLKKGVFQNCDQLHAIDLNNIIEIGSHCFEQCSVISEVKMRVVEMIGPFSLASIQLLINLELPSTLREIQEFAFSKTAIVNITGDASNLEIITTSFLGCSDLVSLPPLTGIVELQDKSFANCRALTAIHCGPNLTAIYTDCFVGCAMLETFSTDAHDYFISGEAFLQCTSLKNFDFSRPAEILNNAFEACESLDIIDMSQSSMQSLNDQVFQDCGTLKSVILPPNLTQFSLRTFDGCNIQSLTFTGTDGVLELDKTFVLYDGNLSEVIFYPNCDVVLTETFVGCDSLTRVVLPTKPYVLESTFMHCSNLVKIEKLDHCTSIISGFAYCSSLTQIDSLASLTVLGDQAFFNCFSLISLPSLPLITTIGNYCFTGCRLLKSIDCGNELTTIGSGAFTNCTHLESFRGGSNSLAVNSTAFAYCHSLSNFPFSKVHQIGSEVFSDCYSIVEANLSNLVGDNLVIPTSLFCNCISLTTVVFPPGLSAINQTAFYNCSKLTSVRIYNNSDEFFVYASAFEWCTSLQIVYFEYQPLRLDTYSFASCTSLESVSITNSITSGEVFTGAFENCTSLTHFPFSDYILDIVFQKAFYNCPLSKTIDFRSELFLNISSYAFASDIIETLDFRSLTSSRLAISNKTFSDCPNIKCAMGHQAEDILKSVFDEDIVNGKHCPGNAFPLPLLLGLVIGGSVMVIIIIVVVVVFVLQKKKEFVKNEIAMSKPLISEPKLPNT